MNLASISPISANEENVIISIFSFFLLLSIPLLFSNHLVWSWFFPDEVM